jgi:hypothetical protein
MTVPLWIPFVNRPDLLEKAIRSTWHGGVETIVIDNSNGGDLPDSASVVDTPPVPLTFSQTQNYMLKRAIGETNARTSVWIANPFYLFMHADAEAEGDTVQRLVAMANAYTIQKRKWGVIFTNYDALAAFNTEAFRAVGGWDTMLSWYLSDCDMYRRLRLAGYELIDSGLPVKHAPSQTLNADPAIRRAVNMEVPFREAYYAAKWGGLNEHETFDKPWGGK